MRLSTEEIYEAALDDELFAEIPARIAASVGARSCVLHWRHANGAAEISAHSGYFSDGQMANYAANFVEHDLWTHAGMRQDRLNAAWNVSNLITPGEFQMSRFYNDWIRAMGDDTFHCCGSVMQTAHGLGIIGLHRGATQTDFSPRALQQLNDHVGHLRRMFAIRGQMSALSGERDLLRGVFETSHQPLLIVSNTGRLMTANAAGDAFLRTGKFLRLRNGQVGPSVDGSDAFEAAVANAGRKHHPKAGECILTGKENSCVLASFLPVLTFLPKLAVLITIGVDRKPVPRAAAARHLEHRYGLSRAEVDIALRLADGETVSKIADGRGSTVGTVRTQVKHVLMKLDVRRQSDVVRLVHTSL